ncbi:hypothetical protein TNCV_537441 [Trichonephila clavipes]|nr:hypothetical protein TNCV_537441 [Trichonephila clavipes]
MHTKSIVARGQLYACPKSSFEYHTGDNTIWLGYIPILVDNTLGGGQGSPNLHLPPTSREDLRFDYLE